MQLSNTDVPYRRSLIFDVFGLIFFWLTGFVLAYFSYSHTDSILSLMRRAMFCSVSIVGLALMTVLPFVITMLISMVYNVTLLWLLALAKGFQFSFCTLLIYSAFGRAGWLAQLLLMFSGFSSTILLWSFWLSLIICKGHLRRSSWVNYIVICLLIIIIDLIIIAPLATALTF